MLAEQIRAITIFLLFLGGILFLNWRTRKAQRDFQRDVVTQGERDLAWRQELYERERPFREDSLTTQRQIAHHLDRIATALEARSK